MTSSQLTNDQVIANYRDAYEAFFGTEAPKVRIKDGGGLSVLFDGCSKTYSKIGLHCVTGMMREIGDANG